MDILIAIPVIFFLIPIWLILYILIKLDSEGPALYIHTRVGRDGKEFQCFKFRSMYVGSHAAALAESSEDDRITKMGHYLRKTSLDETPQILNVLFGQMSLVGPRPALSVQVKHFSEEDMWKLKTKPGITGWTQVNGRNSIPYEKRMELDCWYAKNHNIFLDVWIMFRTIGVLLGKKDIYGESSSPVE